MKGKKIISILTIALMVMFTLTTCVSAVDLGDGISIDAKKDNVPTELVNKGNKIIGTIQVVGVLIAVVMITVLGIKYMMGSAEEKAANKKSMLPYLIGAVLVLVGTSIVGLIQNFANNL